MNTETENGNRPKAVSAVIRQNIRCDVRNYIEGFLNGANEEEIWFLRDVLIEWDSNHNSQTESGVPIAESFLKLVDKSRE